MAETAPVEARLLNRDAQIAPGGTLTLPIQVNNFSSAALHVRQVLQLPVGWSQLGGGEAFVLPAGATLLRLVAVSAPRQAPAGASPVVLRLVGADDGEVLTETPLSVQVAARAQLGLEVVEQLPFVLAGDLFTARLQVMNQGNVPFQVRLQAEPEQGFSASLDLENLSLDPGQSQIVCLQVQVPAGQSASRKSLVRVRARAKGPDVGSLERKLAVLMDLLSTSDGPANRFETVASSLTLTAERDSTGQWAGQGTLQAKGALNEAKTRQLDALVRLPTTQQVSAWGQPDWYGLAVTGPKQDLLLGDQHYGLSWLLNPYTQGTGAGFQWRPGAMDLGAHVLQTRWEENNRQMAQGWAGLQVRKGVQLRVNTLHQRGAPGSEGVATSSAASLQTELEPNANTQIYGELGMSQRQDGEGGRGLGYLVRADGQVGELLRYQVARVYASPELAAYYQDQVQDKVYAYRDLALGGDTSLRLRGRLEHMASNLRLAESDEEGAPLLWDGELGGDLSLPDGWFTRLHWLRARGLDRLGSLGDDYLEDSLVLSGGRYLGITSVRVDLSTGRRDDLQTGTRAQQWSALGNTYLALVEGLRLSLSGELGTDENDPAEGPVRCNTGGTLSWDGQQTAFDLGYQYQRASVTAHQVDLRASWDVTPRHKLAARARASMAAGASEWAVQASYTLAFGLPVARNRETGALRGSVVPEGAEVDSLAGMVVLADRRADVTDKHGQFMINGLEPGTYTLVVAPRVDGVAYVVTDPAVLTVIVEAGRVAEVQIPIAQAARLAGRVTLRASAEAGGDAGAWVVGDPVLGGATQAAGMANVLVVAERGEERRIHFTDDQGDFLFKGLSPGEWAVSLRQDDVPAYHRADPRRQVATVANGEEGRVDFQVIPVRRRIQMQQGASLRLTGAAPAEEQPTPVVHDGLPGPAVQAPVATAVVSPVEPAVALPAAQAPLATAVVSPAVQPPVASVATLPVALPVAVPAAVPISLAPPHPSVRAKVNLFLGFLLLLGGLLAGRYLRLRRRRGA